MCVLFADYRIGSMKSQGRTSNKVAKHKIRRALSMSALGQRRSYSNVHIKSVRVMFGARFSETGWYNGTRNSEVVQHPERLWLH